MLARCSRSTFFLSRIRSTFFALTRPALCLLSPLPPPSHTAQPRRALATPATASDGGLVKPTAATAAPAAAPATPSTSAPASPSAPASTVTVEFQRSQAKAMTTYFRAKATLATAGTTSRFGWTPANEKLNGRWVMFGVGVGLLTEFATGVDMWHQLGLMASYLGLADTDAF